MIGPGNSDSIPDKVQPGTTCADGLADLTAAIWLANVSQAVGLTTRHQGKLIEQCQGLSAVYAASVKDLCEWLGGPPEKLVTLNQHFKNANLRKLAEQNALNAWKSGIQVMHRWQDSYPYRLKNISSSPSVLFYRSRDWHRLTRLPLWISVIGTRTPSPYGRQTTRKIVSDLASHQVVTVSGLARGIDTCVHQYSIENNGPTVAVLGCGPDMAYPPENRQMMDRIVECGAVISEYPPGTPPRRQNFPARNRILSGLSDAVVVMEAARKSGTLITAGFAADQGRDVYAVPGSILIPDHDGCHQLIKDGAILLEQAADLLWRHPALYLQQASSYHAPEQPPYERNLLEDQHIAGHLIKALSGQSMGLEALSLELGLSVSETAVALSFLELAGQVICEKGRYALTAKAFSSI